LKVISKIQTVTFNFSFFVWPKKETKKGHHAHQIIWNLRLLVTSLIQLFKWFRAARGLLAQELLYLWFKKMYVNKMWGL